LKELHEVVGQYSKDLDLNSQKNDFNILISLVNRLEEDIYTLAKASLNQFKTFKNAVTNILTKVKRYIIDNSVKSKNEAIDKSNKLKSFLYEAVDKAKRPLAMSNGYNPSNPPARTYDASEPIRMFEE